MKKLKINYRENEGQLRLEERKITGYITLIEPRSRRGLIEYRLRIVTPGGERLTVYIRELPSWLKIGTPADVTVTSIGDRLLIDRISRKSNLHELKITQVIIDEISKETFTVISGRIDGKFFSIPILDEYLVSRLPDKVPSKVYCILSESEGGLKILEIISEKEYAILTNARKILNRIMGNERKINEYVKNLLEEYVNELG